ncbi:MAG: RluA family pseudouridine synthase [Treponema sp.]|jgi:23S rRNA pseudouridine955/2504/2580 synthase|nr:RluA family pseudouridine synthase [Treponema sp.]
MILTAAEDDDGRRLDRILRKALPSAPLSLVHRLLRQGKILVDNKMAGAATKVFRGNRITLPGIALDSQKATRESACGVDTKSGYARPPSLPALEILYEGGGILAVSKAAGVVVHGGNSLEEAVRAYLAGKTAPSLSFRPGPLHRLDKGTSGVIVFSTSLEGARRFSALLAGGKLRKRYLAILEGRLSAQRWEHRLLRTPSGNRVLAGAGGKTAAAAVTPLAAADGLSLVLLEPETGRTHQLRLQAAACGHPLWGDKKYGASGPRRTFFLHALSLEFPRSDPPRPKGAFPGKIEAALPEDFARALTRIFGVLDINSILQKRTRYDTL